MAKKLTQEEFIQKAIAVHGDRYIYSKAVYVGSKQKLTIICKIHGEFEQMPNSHLSGRGCPSCYGTKPHDTESFTQKLNEVHNEDIILCEGQEISGVLTKDTDLNIHYVLWNGSIRLTIFYQDAVVHLVLYQVSNQLNKQHFTFFQ